jgi:ketosteroid isomerase-like protein
MAEENVELLRSLYAAFNRGDFEAAVRAAHPDVELIPPGGQSPIRGGAALRAWMEPDAFEDQRFEPLEFTVNDGRVLVRHRMTGRGAGSGVEFDVTLFVVFTIDDSGLVTRLHGFLPHEEAEALEAAGLSS